MIKVKDVKYGIMPYSAGIGYNHFWKDIYDGYNDSRIGTAHAGAIYFMPLARFTYLSHRNVKLYSGLGIGTAYYTGYNLEDFPSCKFGDVADEAIFTPMLQTIPELTLLSALRI